MRLSSSFVTQTALCALFAHRLLVGAVEVSASQFSRQSFDFIVIGGGSAGLALATRLSDNTKLTVGVIEAGLHQVDDKILIPGMFGATLGDPLYDWNFLSTPQSKLNGQQIPLHRGKVLGGTSALNGMVHSRASKVEYDGLGVLQNPGWDFNVIQNGIMSSENWTAPSKALQKQFNANDDPRDHGTRGAIDTAAYTFYGDIVSPFFQAVKNLGIRINLAMSSGDSTGVWTLNGSIDPKNVTRSYSTNAYYEPNASRRNLVLVTGAHVTKVLSKTQRGSVVATGVQFVSNKQTFTVNVNREVIISAGAIQTPQILELSGIGDKTLLRSLSIPVKVDLPGVGENLQDHFGVMSTFQTLSNFSGPDQVHESPAFAAQALQQYLKNRTGIFSSTATTLAFLPMADIMSDSTARSLKRDLDTALKRLAPSSPRAVSDLQRKWLDNSEVPQLEFVLFPSLTLGTPESGKRYYSVATFLQHAWNRGSVHINTTDPLAPPNVDSRYLESPGDFDAKLLVEALKWVRKASQTQPLKSATLAVLQPPLNATDADLRNHIAQLGGSEWHFAGSAAMLPRSQMGVVDSQLKVYGTSNIRIVDASILPIHIATHPTATLYGIAEHAAKALRDGVWK